LEEGISAAAVERLDLWVRGREPRKREREALMSLVDALLVRMRSAQGQTFVEYALLLAAVSAGVLLTLTWTGLAEVMQTALDTVAGAF
jgi:Flp pilus assembly pilin Flp